MLKEEISAFFEKIPPFHFLSRDELAGIVDAVAMEFYPRGAKILVQGGPPSDFLNVVKKGGVKVSVASEDGKDETVIDYRSERELFGLLSLVSGDRSRANVVAVDDTICYLIPKDKVLTVLQRNPAVNRYFLKSFFINFIDKTQEEARKRHTGIAASERRLFSTSAGELVRRQPVTTGALTTVRTAAAEMAKHRVSSIVVVDGNDTPLGMVTDRDFREKVVARGASVEAPVRDIMSASLVAVDADEFCFEALLKMMRHNIHHILVMDNETLLGLITNHDFMVLQGASPTVLVKDIEKARKLEDLREAVARVQKSAATLMREGAKAYNITGFITEFIEKLLNGIIDLLEPKLGAAPVPYTLFVGGEGGRRELTLSTDLQLGIVHNDLADLAVAGRAAQYFKEFAAALNESLPQCCDIVGPGPALHPAAIKSVSDWLALFRTWARDVRGITPQAAFFDVRPVRGEANRVFPLKDFLLEQAASNREFLFLVATNLVRNRPPLGFFKKFVVEKNGEHKDEFDLLNKGIKPLAESVRLLAAARGVRQTSTIKRLRELKNRFSLERANDAAQAADYLLALLLHTQLEQIEKGFIPDNFINPDELSGFEKKTLKESFLLTTELYDGIEKSYITDIVT